MINIHLKKINSNIICEIKCYLNNERVELSVRPNSKVACAFIAILNIWKPIVRLFH